ncbi:hypothetical protein AN640_02740 [Candidatus Epulonipiscium fishelsonii]|uniref:Uncharacterized protein n=1 Tax=Candidatus Epulonipiscium fishelsonii TaxID=77094 RepID=A0ACC8X8U8_9FIRM|nr:hypothetical protein AN640_02740 [Epulopiscium sp. SCG-D08WGA-EpuloA1]
MELYEGTFMSNKLQGSGIIKYTDGKIYEGDFYEGIAVGKGKILDPKLGTYEGDNKEDGIME